MLNIIYGHGQHNMIYVHVYIVSQQINMAESTVTTMRSASNSNQNNSDILTIYDRNAGLFEL